jgi:hypothetical protein
VRRGAGTDIRREGTKRLRAASDLMRLLVDHQRPRRALRISANDTVRNPRQRRLPVGSV